MAITRGATVSTYVTSSTVTSVSQSHTVDTNTTLLILVISQEAQIALTAEPFWNTTEAFTLIHASTAGASGDVRNYTYGLVSPTSGTFNITYTSASNDNIHHTAINYLGTEDSTVAAATNYLNETVNDATTASTILASGGASGETLLAAGVFLGADGTPASNATSFAELADT